LLLKVATFGWLLFGIVAESIKDDAVRSVPKVNGPERLLRYLLETSVLSKMDIKALVCAHRRMILTFEAVLMISPLWTRQQMGATLQRRSPEVEW
jgi:hypothetical protein